MNVSLQKLFLGLLFILAIPLGSQAQTGRSRDIALETYRGVPATYDFVSTPYNPSIPTRPTNGTVTYTNLGQSNYRAVYTPNPGFVGNDSFVLWVWEGGSLGLWRFRVTVHPSKVDARPDLVYTYINEPVDIDVLFNDSGSSGQLTLKSILLVNNGDATIDAGQGLVTFTPVLDFQGLAQLNYVVCDEFGSCDQGTVSISVLPRSGEAVDTMHVFTKKNKAQAILVPREFQVVMPPANGVYDPNADLPTYTPNAGFVGRDYIELSSGGMLKVVEITVLNVLDNVFAVDDEVATSSYEALEFNVLENDRYGLAAACLSFGTPQFGRIAPVGYPNGTLTYFPPEGFQGVDKFTYTSKAPNCEGEAEQATVYVYVSNFEPAYSKFRMVTPKRTPLIIGYNVPISNFEFVITAQGKLGKARFLEGRVDTTIYGQRIKGQNIILYIPGDNVNTGTDEFEIEYCVVKGGTCKYRKTVKIEVDILNIGDGTAPMCFADCIWAGDTNLDGIVNVEDILPLGTFMGRVGVPRSDSETEVWYGQYGDNWGAPRDGTLKGDLKHVDTNGDSLITALDTTAISRFYGRTHSLAPARVPNYLHTIQLQGDLFAKPGDVIELDMVLGSESNPAVDVYGFAFPFEYNTDFFKPESTQVQYYSNSWLAYGAPVLTMSRNDNAGLLESAFTRTNRLAASGHGKVGRVRVVVEDIITGFRPGEQEVSVDLGGGVGSIADGSGNTFGVQIGTVTIRIDLTGEDKTELDDPAIAQHLLKVFPNPTADFLNLHLNGGHEFQRAQIYNLAGQLMYDSGAMNTRSKRINVSQLRNGIYFLSVQTERGVIREKFEVIR